MNQKNKEIEQAIRKRFSDSDYIYREELYDFLNKNFYTNLKNTTFRWRLYELTKSNVLTSVKRRIYQLSSDKKIYRPNITSFQRKINNLIKRNYNKLNYCTWNSIWFNEFSRHQAAQNIVLLEVKKEFVRSVFNLLIDKSFRNVYLEPKKDIVETYISEYNNSIVVKSLITKSPIIEESGITVPQIEKMLVDLYCDKRLLLPYKGKEENIIFRNAFDEYQIDLSRLINYSKRRNKNITITNYLINTINIEKRLLL